MLLRLIRRRQSRHPHLREASHRRLVGPVSRHRQLEAVCLVPRRLALRQVLLQRQLQRRRRLCLHLQLLAQVALGCRPLGPVVHQ